jgi:hypothetical protein
MLLNPFLLERAVNETRRQIPKHLGAKMKLRHESAIKKASERLTENPYIDYQNGKLLILSDALAESGAAKFYETTQRECRLIEPGNSLCHAFWDGYPCWHRAQLRVVENYLLMAGAHCAGETAEVSTA